MSLGNCTMRCDDYFGSEGCLRWGPEWIKKMSEPLRQSSRGGTLSRPSPLIPPDVQISRIRRTEGVSTESTRRLTLAAQSP